MVADFQVAHFDGHLAVDLYFRQDDPVHLPGKPAADEFIDQHADGHRLSRLDRGHLIGKLYTRIVMTDAHRPMQLHLAKRPLKLFTGFD